MDLNLNELVFKAIELYNRYRSPEATAKLVSVEKNVSVIEFKGAFCLSCGVRDFFEDFIYELEELGRNVRAEINQTKQTGPQSFRVYFVFEHSFFGAETGEETLFREFLQKKGLSFREYLASNACTKDVIKFHFRTWLLESKPKPKN